jgi:hypothetical protein
MGIYRPTYLILLFTGISITKAISMVKGVRTVDQTKNSKARVIPIDAQTVAGLRTHRVRQKQEKLSCSNWRNPIWCSAGLTETAGGLTLSTTSFKSSLGNQVFAESGCTT